MKCITASALSEERQVSVRHLGLLLLLLLFYAPSFVTKTNGQMTGMSEITPFDVIHYDAQVELDMAKKTVTGKVLIRLVAHTNNQAEIELDCGDLTIDAVRESGEVQKLARNGPRLSVLLTRPAQANEMRQIEVNYHGAPRRGLHFFPKRDQIYTVFSTSQWLVCVDKPYDKATLRLNLILPAGLQVVANGRLVAQRTLPQNKTAYEWLQETPVSTYTFGFAAGRFHVLTQQQGRLHLRYLSDRFSDSQLQHIFRDTADMISFFEDRAGVQYTDTTYTQVLAAGGVAQEMSGFTVIRETYGREVLANKRAVWLAAHELAHQWWGNMVTCKDWTDFWLNEGMATFMADAYKEHRFGQQEYLSEIEESRQKYEVVRKGGKDRSLVFPDWLHPTEEDRVLVYDKGAYVLHLLRLELGERSFWAGIRHYTRTYWGKSVLTDDFQKAMERESGKSLKEFFAKWVYLTQR